MGAGSTLRRPSSNGPWRVVRVSVALRLAAGAGKRYCRLVRSFQPRLHGNQFIRFSHPPRTRSDIDNLAGNCLSIAGDSGVGSCRASPPTAPSPRQRRQAAYLQRRRANSIPERDPTKWLISRARDRAAERDTLAAQLAAFFAPKPVIPGAGHTTRIRLALTLMPFPRCCYLVVHCGRVAAAAQASHTVQFPTFVLPDEQLARRRARAGAHGSARAPISSDIPLQRKFYGRFMTTGAEMRRTSRRVKIASWARPVHGITRWRLSGQRRASDHVIGGAFMWGSAWALVRHPVAADGVKSYVDYRWHQNIVPAASRCHRRYRALLKNLSVGEYYPTSARGRGVPQSSRAPRESYPPRVSRRLCCTASP